jgi:hypothetical protein
MNHKNPHKSGKNETLPEAILGGGIFILLCSNSFMRKSSPVILIGLFLLLVLLFGCLNNSTINNTRNSNNLDELNTLNTSVNQGLACYVLSINEIREKISVSDLYSSDTVAKENENGAKYWYCVLRSQSNKDLSLMISFNDYSNAIKSDYYYSSALDQFNELIAMDCNTESPAYVHCEKDLVNKMYWVEKISDYGDSQLIAVVNYYLVKIDFQKGIDKETEKVYSKKILDIIK